ncbi:MAG: nitroreductase family protein [Firmicutes bacterium]|nr:nitroreductase family protein [Bacillota bacterium]MDH7496803.1 nitroreductase family protein [Bacillota bacterium]
MTKDLVEAIEQRRSVREFKPDAVPDATISRIIGCALMAPSAGNIQPWRFWVVKRPDVKAALADAAFGQGFVKEAPVVVVVAVEPKRSESKYGRRGSELYCIQDTAAAIENMLLTAVAYGLGACWVGAFDEDAARRALGLPEGERPVAMIPIGYPKRDPAGKRPRPQRPWEEVVVVVD